MASAPSLWRGTAGRVLRLGSRRRTVPKDAARLVQTRGRAMQSAVPAGEGAMAAVLG